MSRILRVTDLGPRYVMGDPKPEKRKKATRAEWEQIREEKLGECRCCGKRAASLHHVLPRSLGGSDVAANLVGLCGSGTTGCHGLVEARDPWACSLLGQRLTVAERAYVIGRKGAAFLRRYYGIEEAA